MTTTALFGALRRFTRGSAALAIMAAMFLALTSAPAQAQGRWRRAPQRAAYGQPYGFPSYGYGDPYNSNPYGQAPWDRHTSKGKDVAVVAGTVAGGAILGGLLSGKKGAIIGAAIGAAGGSAIVVRRHRNNNRYNDPYYNPYNSNRLPF